MSRALLILGVCLASLATTGSAEAGRVVLFEILVDGKVVLNVRRLDQGEDADTAWGYLKTTALTNPAENFVISDEEAAACQAFQEQLAKSAGETKATVKGKCRIFCRYAGDINVDELRLVRANPKAPWFIDPAQVDEMAKKRTIDTAKRTRGQVDATGK